MNTCFFISVCGGWGGIDSLDAGNLFKVLFSLLVTWLYYLNVCLSEMVFSSLNAQIVL